MAVLFCYIKCYPKVDFDGIFSIGGLHNLPTSHALPRNYIWR